MKGTWGGGGIVSSARGSCVFCAEGVNDQERALIAGIFYCKLLASLYCESPLPSACMSCRM